MCFFLHFKGDLGCCTGGHQKRVLEVPLAVMVNTKIIVPARITVMWVLGIFYCSFFVLCVHFILSLFLICRTKLSRVFVAIVFALFVGKTDYCLFFFMSPLYICLFFSVRGFVLAFTCSCTCVCSAKGLLSADAELINRLCVHCLASAHLGKTAVTSHRPFR